MTEVCSVKFIVFDNIYSSVSRPVLRVHFACR